jgi:3-carboxy-cis,cis-muconate cycloisomerase
MTLLAQTEVAEVAEAAGDGRGGSSSLPHKRNPVGAVRCRACARLVRGAAATLLGSMAQEHERATGSWQAEWPALSEALAMTGGAAHALREALDGLEVRPESMARNLEATGGLVMAESVTMAIAERIGRDEARRIVDAACRRVGDGGTSLREELLGEQAVTDLLGADGIDAALDPSGYLGSADAFIVRALERYAEEGP